MTKPGIIIAAPGPVRDDRDRQGQSPANILDKIGQLHLQELLNQLQKKFPLPERRSRNLIKAR